MRCIAVLSIILSSISALDARPLPIVATSRTWTDSEDGAGSFGQGIPATPWAEEGELNPLERRIVGMMSTDDVRTNVGVVNLSETTQGTFSIEILDGDGQSLASHWFELPPNTRVQWNRLPAYLGLEGSNLSAVVHLAGWSDMTPGVPQEDVETPDWVAYASVVDNRTNDPAFIAGTPLVPPDDGEPVSGSGSGCRRHRMRSLDSVADAPSFGMTWWGLRSLARDDTKGNPPPSPQGAVSSPIPNSSSPSASERRATRVSRSPPQLGQLSRTSEIGNSASQ